MTTTRTTTGTRPCTLCSQPGATHTPDGINYFCEDATSCLDRAQAYLEATGYRDAIQEMYELFKAREARAKAYWYKCVSDTERLAGGAGPGRPNLFDRVGAG